MKEITVADIFRSQDLSIIGINTLNGYYKHINSLIDKKILPAEIKKTFNTKRIYIKEHDWNKYMNDIGK
jgi:hypothetical protein